ncbi:isoprenylcysteine carboxylmethyltransferase family protein [Evansella sp. AB-rgal1]|uniref:isoprenylcysteine carboxylmethyltransferase family protein n=1 Tax=Evansella sp. AB-rgal1 TaxID=3242696 RepID=UPI00359DACD9
MNITTLFFIILLTAWLLEWFVFEETAKKKKEVSKNTIYVKALLPFMFMSAILSSYLLGRFSEEITLWSQMTGVSFIFIGLLLRYWTYFLTKQHFTRKMVIIENRPLYSSGPFRFTRHPFHMGFFFITQGICIYLSGNWLSILITFIFVGTALHYRMTLEESFYSKRYGEIYAYWCKHRFRLLPFVY